MRYKNILNNLYNRKIKCGQSDLECKFKEYNDTFNIELKDSNNKFDCIIGHFGYNFYFRTSYGLKYKKYKNIYTLFNAVKKTALNSNLTLESLGIKINYKYRALISV